MKYDTNRIFKRLKLTLTPKEKEEQMEKIDKTLEWLSAIKEIKTDNIEPIFNVLDDMDFCNTQEDEIINHNLENVLNETNSKNNHFKVPKVL